MAEKAFLIKTNCKFPFKKKNKIKKSGNEIPEKIFTLSKGGDIMKFGNIIQYVFV